VSIEEAHSRTPPATVHTAECRTSHAQDQAFGQPEDEIGKAERVLGWGRQLLEQVDMVEGDDAEAGEGERLLLRGDVEPRGEEAQRIERRGRDQPFLRIVADDRRPCGLLKCLDNRHAESRNIDMPRLDLTGKDQQRERREHRSVNHLSNQNLGLARIAVGGAAGDWGK